MLIYRCQIHVYISLIFVLCYIYFITCFGSWCDDVIADMLSSSKELVGHPSSIYLMPLCQAPNRHIWQHTLVGPKSG